MYLQIQQAAKLLGVSRQSVHAWIVAGKLRTALVVGHRVVVQDDAFRALQKAKNGRKQKAPV